MLKSRVTKSDYYSNIKFRIIFKHNRYYIDVIGFERFFSYAGKILQYRTKGLIKFCGLAYAKNEEFKKSSSINKDIIHFVKKT